MSKVCIDPGHGGSDSGGTGLGRKEKNDVLEIALKIRDLLTRQGVTVVMTRTTDKDITINQRCNLANKEKCDYFLSIHRDAYSDPTANGSSIYVHSQATAETTDKANRIYTNVLEASGFRKRGLKKGAANYTDYGVNKQTNMPSALLELGFITSTGDNEKFVKHNDNIALAIAQGICDILGVNYKTVSEPEQNDGTLYVVQAGAFKSKVNADLLAAQLKAKGFDAIVKVAGDIDGDGKLTTSDARELLRNATGLS